ncbi:protein phosphatase CheZ [Prosthecomicrobium sp. N25]|uniref:protein phosphatase CheZ n=1 Tax=Prosthecomicrobium sp. N25 TaxID=3129254 RepID=UPI003078707D
MASDAESSSLPAEDYQAIEDAVMETARGRWFLAEFARRNRVAETAAITATLERLERLIKRERQVPDIDRIRLDLADMAEAISRTKQEIAQMKFETDEGGRFAMASNELDAIVSQTEQATNDILLNAEQVQELAWTLREEGVDGALCDRLDQSATDIYTACSFQDLTGQRTRKVVTVLRYVESRINSMIGIWGMDALTDIDIVPDAQAQADQRPDAHLLNGPALVGQGIDQSAVDDLMGDGGTDAAPAAAPPGPDAADGYSGLVIEDDVGIVVPVETEPAGARADVFAPAAADVFAARPVEDTPDVFAAAGEPGPAADVFADADVFAPAAPLAPKRSRTARSRPATVGNTALAVAPDAEAVAAVAEEPALAVVANEDPIAVLSAEDRLLTFG